MHKYKQSTAEISISNARYFLGTELHLAMNLAMTTGKISAMDCGNSKFCATTSTVQKHSYKGADFENPQNPTVGSLPLHLQNILESYTKGLLMVFSAGVPVPFK